MHIIEKVKVVVEKVYLVDHQQRLHFEVVMSKGNIHICVTFARRLTLGNWSFSSSAGVKPRVGLCKLFELALEISLP